MRTVLLILLTLFAAPSRACDLALILAVDVSGSVDPDEYRTQMQGLSDALGDAVVAEALIRGHSALLLMQWTGESRQVVSIPWTQIDSPAALDAFAAEVATMPRRWRNFSTAMGEALDLALAEFARAPVCGRRVVDISGDGSSNEGREPQTFHDALARAGVTVNALSIEGSEDGLTDYFRDNVITGPGAFVMPANGYQDYPDRIRRKLIRETASAFSALPKD